MGAIMYRDKVYGAGGSGGGGSTVTITPTLSTGTKIANFEIDGTSGELYAPQGGGGAIDYSTTEQVIGTWIDGKPIYQITETLSSEVNITTSAYTGFTPSWIGNVAQFIDCMGYRVASSQYGTACHPLFARKSGSNQLSLYSALTFNGVKYITFQYTKTTD